MRYFDSGEISHKICTHEIFWFWCNISWNLQPWDILILVKYLMKSATMRYFDSGIIFHEICNREILQLLCIILWNLWPWDIDISWNTQPRDIGFWAYTSTNTIYWILVKHLTFNPDILNQTNQNQIWPWDIQSDHFKSNI